MHVHLNVKQSKLYIIIIYTGKLPKFEIWGSSQQVAAASSLLGYDGVWLDEYLQTIGAKRR